MYCTVYTTGNGSVIYINPNCNMKLIYEYLRIVSEVPDSNAESTGELFNPLPLMHHTNHDFDSVFTKIKRYFGIPLNEPIDDSDASLIFEHLLLAYRENKLDISSTSNVSGQTKRRSPEKKKRSHSVGSITKKKQPVCILALWREEKLARLAKSRTEGRGSSLECRSSFLENRQEEEEEEEGDDRVFLEEEKMIPEEQIESRNEKKTIQFQKRTSQTGGKKGPKKHPKKTGKDAKEDAQLQKAAPSTQTSLTPKPSFSRKLTGSDHQQQLDPVALKTLWKSKSSLFVSSDFQEPISIEPSDRRLHDSIRQFFKDHPTGLTNLPKIPVVDSDSRAPGGQKDNRKTKKLAMGPKKNKVTARMKIPNQLDK